MSLLANSNAIESGGYNIDRSLRFRSSASAYLSRTLTTPTNNKKWTFSVWCKLGSLSGYQMLLSANSGSYKTYLYANYNNNTIAFYQTSGAAYPILLNTGVPLLRDPSAWYHIVLQFDTTQATASNRVQIYVNNQLYTFSGSPTYPALNNYCDINTACAHAICGNVYNTTEFFDGYLAEVNFIDGQALTPSSFGQTDAVTGVWVPKKYTGTYGTNGFYLNFSDNTSATTLAYDKSGNGNNWTPNNISTTAGATYDSMTDVPTLTSATAANFCVLNPLASRSVGTMQNGNMTWKKSDAAGDNYCCVSTMSIPSSGKWYWELTVTDGASGANSIGIVPDTSTSQQTTNTQPGATNLTTNSFGYYSDGNKYTAGSGAAYGNSYTTGDVIGIAVDTTNGKIWWAKNGTWQASGDPAAGTNAAFTTLSGSYYAASSVRYNGNQHDYNFGQRPFSYTPPTGFKALNTFNLPDPTIKKPNQYMDATTYTGTGSGTTKSVTNSGSFQPDLVWVKSRSNAYWHNLQDAVRGSGYALFSNSTSAESNDVGTRQISFASNGFSVSGSAADDINLNGGTFVGWQWKESATAGFDIVTYTGNGSGQTISHSLGVAPKMMIIKSRSNGVYGWSVYHEATGNTKYLILNQTDAASTNSGFWNNTSPTSTNFTIGTNIWVSGNTYTYVAYLFAEIAGFSKFGSYTGNGSTDGPFVYCGFRPRYIMIKRTDSTGDWHVLDTARDTYNVAGNVLYPNLSSAESGVVWTQDILSNGFKLRITGANENASGGTYIYAAFAENPFKYSNAR